jgi:tetratricopeptide (TPR) repeat protein
MVFFQTMVADAPRSARSHRELGTMLTSARRFPEARQAFERSLAIKPEDATTLYNFGNAYSAEGRFADAAASYRRAIALNPTFGQAYENPSLYSVAVAGNMGIAIGEIGAIYLSSDGGQTWARQDSTKKESGPKWFRAISVVPGGNGVIVGAAGARVRIVDGRVQQSDGGERAAEAVH